MKNIYYWCPFIGNIAKIAILIFVGAMGLRQMGIANEIINMAFGFTLGAIAVALAIAFGIGGRDMAAKKLEEFDKCLKEEKFELLKELFEVQLENEIVTEINCVPSEVT